MHFSTLFFDLDATLYPASNGLWELIKQRIYQYMREEIGIPEDEIPATRDRYWKTYGTTLEGLRIHHQINPENYLAFVHDLPLNQYLKPDLELRSQLGSLPQALWVFTNADRQHAARVLQELGIEDLFAGIVDLLALKFVVKPNPEAYRIALDLAGKVAPSRCVMFDDLLPNLHTAKNLGFTTSFVGEKSPNDSVDFHLSSIHEMKAIMPFLWNGQKT